MISLDASDAAAVDATMEEVVVVVWLDRLFNGTLCDSVESASVVDVTPEVT